MRTPPLFRSGKGSSTWSLPIAPLMDVDDMPAAIAEAGRVLEQGGHFCLCVTHPIADAGRFASREPDAPFVVLKTYFGPRPFEGGTFEREGLTMTFRGWSHSIEEYSRAIEEAGLVIERIREPVPVEAGVAKRSSMFRWTRLPLFLQIRAVKPRSSVPASGS